MHAPLFSTTGEVLLVVAMRPDLRVREIAALVGVTERTVMHALTQLSEEGAVTVGRQGRRNVYHVSAEATCSVGDARVKVAVVVDALRKSMHANLGG